MPAIWASFRNKMIDDAMISNFLQPQSCFSRTKGGNQKSGECSVAQKERTCAACHRQELCERYDWKGGKITLLVKSAE
jgi:hypothetical protein